jgi:hypothetical protein
MDDSVSTVSRKARRFYRKFNTFPAHKKLLVIFFLVLALPLTVYLVKSFTLYLSQAANATVSFSPSTMNMPPNTSPGVVVNSGSAQIAFARVDISFDTTKVNLSNEINVTGPLKAVIGKTAMATANSTGKIAVVVALCNGIDIPCSPSPTAPSGTFELFKLPLTSVTGQTTSTSLTYDVSTMQLVDTNQANVTLSTTNGTINLNPVSATNTNAPTATNRPSTTNAPTSTNAPTATRVPTFTPQPTNSNTQAATTLSLSARSSTVNLNQNLPVNVQINTGTNSVIGLELDVTFDRTKFAVQDFTAGSFFSNPDITNKVLDNTNGRARLTLATPPGTSAKQGSGTVAVLMFKAIDTGTTRVDFGANNLVAAINMSGINALRSVTGLGLTITNSFILGDINRDGCVDIVDYVILFANFGKNTTDSGADARADINNDGKINILDYTYLFENFGRCNAN